MAKGLKGITVEINGNTKPLNEALSSVNANAKSLQSELKGINTLLKLDPKNTDLLKQKQVVLAQAISETKAKLDTLNAAQKQMAESGKGIEDENYRNLQREIALTTKNLADMEAQQKKTAKEVNGFGSKLPSVSSALKALGSAAQATAKGGFTVLTSVVGGTTKAFGAFAAGAASAVVAVGTASAKAAMDLEATEAKYETVFKGYTQQMDKTIEDFQKLTPATQAAAQSMASGLQDLLIPMGLERQDATEMTSETMHLIGALTNFNSGTHTAQDVQGAFASALTGSYESLKALGIQVSTETVKQKAFEMGLADSADSADKAAQAQALLALATEQSGDALAAYNEESLDTKTRMELLKSDITDMAAEMGQDLLPTINELLAAARDLLQDVLPNFTIMFSSLVGIFTNTEGAVDSFTQSFGDLATTLIERFTGILPQLVTVVTNLIPALTQAFFTLIDAVVQLIPTLIPQLLNAALLLFTSILDGLNQTIPTLLAMLPQLIQNITATLTANLPHIIESGVNILLSLIDGITNAIPSLIDAILALFPVIVNNILTQLPKIVQSGINLLISLINGILQAIPQLIAMLPTIITTIVQTLASMLPQIINSGITLLNSLISGILQAIPQLIAALPQVITAIVNTIIANLPQIISSGITLIGALISGLIQAIPTLIAAIPQIISAIWDTITNVNWGELGGNIISGVIQGVKNAASSLINVFKDLAKSALDAVKDFFGIHSPSRVMRDQVGKMLPAGMAEGVEDGMDEEEDRIAEAMRKGVPTTIDSYINTKAGTFTAGTQAAAGGFQQNINIYSPKELSPSEVARQTRNQTRQMVLKLKTG